MATYAASAPVRRNSHLIPAALALAVAGLLSPLHVSLFNVSWPLVWLPFAVVALWPRQASAVPSAVILFFGGLWVDVATLGALGQWPLIFLVTYAVVRPDMAEPGGGVARSLARVATALLVAVPVLALSGRFVYGVWPDWGVVGRGLFVLIVSLPFIALLRDLFAGRLSRDD